MRKTRIGLLLAAAGAMLLTGPTAGAHVWPKIEGSIAASTLAGCGGSPGCSAWTLMNHQSVYDVAHLPCNETLALKDGPDYSIVKLPTGVAGHRARLSWTATAGPVSVSTLTGAVNLDFLGGPSGCNEFKGFFSATETPATLTIPPGAVWVEVTAVRAVDLRWSLEGIAH